MPFAAMPPKWGNPPTETTGGLLGKTLALLTEGVLMYSLDDALVFDPTDLGAQVHDQPMKF